jgi:hypothetical protein
LPDSVSGSRSRRTRRGDARRENADVTAAPRARRHRGSLPVHCQVRCRSFARRGRRRRTCHCPIAIFVDAIGARARRLAQPHMGAKEDPHAASRPGTGRARSGSTATRAARATAMLVRGRYLRLTHTTARSARASSPSESRGGASALEDQLSGSTVEQGQDRAQDAPLDPHLARRYPAGNRLRRRGVSDCG